MSARQPRGGNDVARGALSGRSHQNCVLPSRPTVDFGLWFKRAMPDAHVKVERMCSSDDTAIVEGRFVATHTGPLASADGDTPPTGSKIDLGFADIVRVADGQIASYHTYYDQLSLLTQLGLMGDD